MPTDRYTKIVLTVIAGALVALEAQNAIAPAQAQRGMCGGRGDPCYVAQDGTWRVEVVEPSRRTGPLDPERVAPHWETVLPPRR